jgi:hypothetical protein
MSSKLLAAFALAAVILPAASFADEGVDLTDAVKAQIQTKLTADGYDVGKIKTEDGLYEAYAKKDGKKMEVFLNAALEVVRTKIAD